MKTDIEKYITTDLACESGRISPELFRHAGYARRSVGSATVEVLTVTDAAGEEETGKPAGRYVTVSDESLKTARGGTESVCAAVRDELLDMIKDLTGKESAANLRVLVAGLGNRFITPDALGARCADKINATRQLKGVIEGFGELGCAEVSTVDPGVLSSTGIESFDIIKGAADRIKPDIVIVIDAMAARSTSRLATTVQLSDAGLAPGGGIGNARPAINRESVGCHVISIGTPTVVSSSTLIADALCAAGESGISPELEEILENGKSFFVSLNDSDIIVERISDAISKAVNLALGADCF